MADDSLCQPSLTSWHGKFQVSADDSWNRLNYRAFTDLLWAMNMSFKTSKTSKNISSTSTQHCLICLLFFSLLCRSFRHEDVAQLFILFNLNFKNRLISTKLTIICCLALLLEIVMQVGDMGFYRTSLHFKYWFQVYLQVKGNSIPLQTNDTSIWFCLLSCDCNCLFVKILWTH